MTGYDALFLCMELPLLAVWMIGAAVAGLRLRTHPRAAGMVLVALLGSALLWLLSMVFWMGMSAAGSNVPVSAWTWLSVATSVLRPLAGFVLITLVAAASLVDR